MAGRVTPIHRHSLRSDWGGSGRVGRPRKSLRRKPTSEAERKPTSKITGIWVDELERIPRDA